MLIPQKNVTFSRFTLYMVCSFLLFTQVNYPLKPTTVYAQEDTTATAKVSRLKEASEIWDVSKVSTSQVQSQRKLIALTFDDSPASTLDGIVKVFLDYNSTHSDAPATATIFCNGKNIKPSTHVSLQTAFAAGFELGNHTQNHKNLFLLSPEEIKEELIKTDRLLHSFDKKSTHLIRAPYGNVNENVRSVATAPIIDWFIDTLDWTGISEEIITETVLTGCFSGAIILMHDGYPQTINALKRLLPALKEKGYQAVNVSKLIKAHRFVFYRGKEYVRARKR